MDQKQRIKTTDARTKPTLAKGMGIVRGVGFCYRESHDRRWLPVALLTLVLGAKVQAGPREHLLAQANIQRFQALRRQSDNTPPIRVLIYGQSITGQPWSRLAVQQTADQSPKRGWVIENRSIGGVTAEYLVRTAEADLYPFNPDLVIFHAYGDTNAYVQLIREVRTRTTAEVILVNDHYANWDRELFPQLGEWNGNALPALAKSEQVCIADVRTRWRQVLLERGLPISALLQDHVHPNADGQAVLGDVLKSHLTGPASIPLQDPYSNPRVRRIFRVGAPDARLEWRVQFQGNRIVGRIPPGAEASVLIDGLPPGSSLAGRVHGRAPTWPGSFGPFVVRIGHQVPLLDEVWTLRIDRSSPQERGFNFTVHGSRTGDDGSGHTGTPFRSNSGRVLLDPQDWYWAALLQPLAEGTLLRWQTVGTGVDRVTNPRTAVADTWVDLASNLPLGIHELVLTAPDGTLPITELIAYDPTSRTTRTGSTVYLLANPEGMVLDSDSALEMSPDLMNGSAIGGDDSGQTPFWVPSTNVTSLFFRAKPAARR